MSNLRLSGGENYIPSAEIASRVEELGAYYSDLYRGEPLVTVGLMRGAVRFAVHLGEAIDNPEVYEDFMRTQKMDGANSGKVVILSEPDIHIKGMNVLVIEDVDDKRDTLLTVLPRLRRASPKRLDLACLLNKPNAEKTPGDLPVDDVQYAFQIENRFVVYYGLDWNGLYRNKSHISAAHNIAEPGQPELWVPMVPDEYKIGV